MKHMQLNNYIGGSWQGSREQIILLLRIRRTGEELAQVRLSTKEDVIWR